MNTTISGLIFAQNKEKFEGYTVFHIPTDEGDTLKMMTLKDVKAVLNRRGGQ